MLKRVPLTVLSGDRDNALAAAAAVSDVFVMDRADCPGC